MINPAQKFELAFVASLLLNAAVWVTVAGAVQYKLAPPPPALEFTRVVIDKRGHTAPKVVHHIPPPKPKPKPPPQVQPRRVEKPPPETSHNRVITAAPRKNAAPKPADFAALNGGNHRLGAPIESQGSGNAVESPPTRPAPPPPTAPVEQPKPAPPVEQSKPAPPPPPPPIEQPKPEPAPVEPPKPKGPTRDAEPTHQVNVEIPDDLKTQSFKSFVRVRVTISSDGSYTVFMKTSSGNAQVDKLVLDALNKWKWKPALKDGEPVDSVQAFRFDFEVK